MITDLYICQFQSEDVRVSVTALQEQNEFQCTLYAQKHLHIIITPASDLTVKLFHG